MIHNTNLRYPKKLLLPSFSNLVSNNHQMQIDSVSKLVRIVLYWSKHFRLRCDNGKRFQCDWFCLVLFVCWVLFVVFCFVICFVWNFTLQIRWEPWWRRFQPFPNLLLCCIEFLLRSIWLPFSLLRFSTFLFVLLRWEKEKKKKKKVNQIIIQL